MTAPERENVYVPVPEGLADAPWPEIWAYAYAGSDGRIFDGYEFALRHLGVDAAELANFRSDEFHRTGRWDGTFEELRCCLFCEARRHRHFGYDPDPDGGQDLRALIRAIERAQALTAP